MLWTSYNVAGLRAQPPGTALDAVIFQVELASVVTGRLHEHVSDCQLSWKKWALIEPQGKTLLTISVDSWHVRNQSKTFFSCLSSCSIGRENKLHLWTVNPG